MANAGMLITAIIAGVVLFIIGLSVYGIQQNAADSLRLTLQERCEVGSESFVRVYKAGTEPGTVDGAALGSIANSSGACTVTWTASADNVTSEVRSEHGRRVAGAVTGTNTGIANSASGTVIAWSSTSKYKEALAVLQQFSGLNTIMLGMIPVLGAAAAIAAGASGVLGFAQYRESGNVSTGIMLTLIGVVIQVVVLFVLPNIFEYIDTNYQMVNSGQLTNTEEFGRHRYAAVADSAGNPARQLADDVRQPDIRRRPAWP